MLPASGSGHMYRVWAGLGFRVWVAATLDETPKPLCCFWHDTGENVA